MLRLAEFQVRLLLCKPAGRRYHGGREVLSWDCGCAALQCAAKKYAVQPCDGHETLLTQVTESDERPYDGFLGVALSATSARGSA